MGCTVGRPPRGLTAGRGRGVLGLGGLRVCEGVRGRARACEGVFYPDPKNRQKNTSPIICLAKVSIDASH